MLEIEDLKVHFPVGQNLAVRAVDGISLSLGAGQTVGLVGESGSGKSTVGKAALRLLKPTSGRIVVGGVDVTSAKGKVLREVRRKAQMIFQDPHSSLNPRMTIFRSVAEPLILHTKTRGRELNMQVAALLERVGLPSQFLHRFPHELSGGQKQRVCIARALALNPSLLVLDEPTSALDVSVQAQILEFLKELHAQRAEMTSLFISHDLAVVRFLCSRVAVMYLGRIVEEGATEQVFAAPQHPYTRALLSAVPLPQSKQSGTRIRLSGDIPSPTKPPTGCAFHPRCPEAINGVCDAVEPVFEQTGTGSWARCHLLSRKAA